MMIPKYGPTYEDKVCAQIIKKKEERYRIPVFKKYSKNPMNIFSFLEILQMSREVIWKPVAKHVLWGFFFYKITNVEQDFFFL